MRIDENELAIAFAKASLSNIPVAGGVLAETLGALVQTTSNDAIAERYRALTNAIIKIAPTDLQDDLCAILGTTTYERLKEKLDLLYFSNGVSAEKACDVFVCGWDSGAFPEFLTLSDQDHLSILLYAIGKVADLLNKYNVLGGLYIPPESNEKIIRNFYIALSKMKQENLRYSDIASAFLLLSRFQFQTKRISDAAVSLIKCIENALYQGTRMVRVGPAGLTIGTILHDLGSAFLYLQMLDLAEDAYTRSYSAIRQHSPRGAYPSLLQLCLVYEQMGATQKAVSTYEHFLDETLPYLKEDGYNKNDRFWSQREHAAYFVMENKRPKPDANCSCLCGSGEPYLWCCSQILSAAEKI